MKNSIKKITLLFILFLNILYTKVHCNMTLEAIEESQRFVDEHAFIFYTSQIISIILTLSFLIFVFVIPFILIYRKIKYKKSDDVIIQQKTKSLVSAEVFLIAFLLLNSMFSGFFRNGSQAVLCGNIFNIIFSALLFRIILPPLFKKDETKYP